MRDKEHDLAHYYPVLDDDGPLEAIVASLQLTTPHDLALKEHQRIVARLDTLFAQGKVSADQRRMVIHRSMVKRGLMQVTAYAVPKRRDRKHNYFDDRRD